MVSRSLVFFLLLASAEFFRIFVIPQQINLLIVFCTTIFLIISFLLFIIYDKGKFFPQNFTAEVSMFILASITAMIGAKLSHGQNFFLSFWAESYMYFYFLYFFLHILKLRPHELERLILAIAIIYFIIYFLQYLIYPRLITNARVSMDRGTIRIFLPGSGFAKLIFFFFLAWLFKTNNYKFGIFCLIYLVMQMLQGTRSALATTLLVSLIYILFSRYVRSRFAVVLLTGFAAILFFFAFQDLINSMIEVSSKQMAQEEDDVREKSANFYLYEFSPTPLHYILGNGIGHMRSAYGMRMMQLKLNHLYIQSDIGIIGAHSIFGIFYVIGAFLILRKIFITKIHPRYLYIRYFALVMVIESIIWYPFMDPSTIAAITVILYIMDVSNYELKLAVKDHREKSAVTT